MATSGGEREERQAWTHDKGVNDCLLDNCQISSLPHDCVA